ncbi:MAG: succinate dehydrogenase cytochrome b subunit [Clostridium sp.]|nr:succinate dehydrogenase cytochrome b subunit [Clostridium sp.]
MWLTSSSIGRKFVMAITGICLVLFVTFHCVMNAVAIVWPTAYNVICEFLGANWYALIASAGLALLFILHIIYATVLTIQNRKARGNDRYLVTSRPPQVEWSSKNMYILGIVILAFLVVHLIQFWARMQLMEIIGCDYSVNGVTYAPQFGTLFIQAAFSEVWTPIVYIIGFCALWFHLNHGFWSMLHSVGWDNNTWINRLKCIGCWWTSIVVALFVAQAIVFTVQAHKNYYLTDPKLQEQYAEAIKADVQALIDDINAEMSENPYDQQGILIKNAEKMAPIVKQYQALCKDVKIPEAEMIVNVYNQYAPMVPTIEEEAPASAPVIEEEVIEAEAVEVPNN